MKHFLILFTIIFFQISFAQEIHFVTPQNGQIVTDPFYSDKVNVNIDYGYTLDPNPLYEGYYIKLIINSTTTYSTLDGGVIPSNVAVPSGIQEWTLELWERVAGHLDRRASQQITFTVKYEVMFSNIFQSGNIKVDQTTVTSGFTAQKVAGEIVTGEYIDQHYNSNNWIWNSQPINQSEWQRKKKGQYIPYNLNQLNRSINYYVETDDNQAQIIAKSSECANISRQDYLTEINQTINAGVVSEIVPGVSGLISAPPRTYNGENYFFYSWSDGNTSNPRTIIPTGPTTYTALYKGVHLSQDANSFINNNQNKTSFVFNNHYMVYESQGKIWCEYSTNDGASWQFTNPPTAGAGTNPTISKEYIVFQNEGDIKVWHLSGSELSAIGQITDDIPGSKGMPAISVSDLGMILIAFVDTDCLRYVVATYGGYPLQYINQSNSFITGIVNNPTLSCSPNSNIFHLAWEESNQIKYRGISVSQNYQPSIFRSLNPSSNLFYSENYRPSIIGVGNAEARLSWIGKGTDYWYNEETDEYIPYEISNALFKACDGTGNNNYWAFGNDVQSVNINQSNNAYVLAWGRLYHQSTQCINNSSFSNIINFSNLLGKDVQVSNGLNNSDMRLFNFNSSQSPYEFKDQIIFDNAPIIESNLAFTREGVVETNSAQFYFGVENVKLNGILIPLKNIPDTAYINSMSHLNSYLESNAFEIDNNSIINYGIVYGITDSLQAYNALANGKYVLFKVELVDANSGEVYMMLNNLRFDQNKFNHFSTGSYQINPDGLGNRLVKIRTFINTNVDGKFSLLNKIMSANASTFNKVKSKSKIINFKDPVIASYSLMQNYPNPFNPSTKIQYNVPERSHVSIKIYDLLGKEITTLVEEEKEAGIHEVTFNGSNFSSGVYVYKMNAGTFNSQRKLVLLK